MLNIDHSNPIFVSFSRIFVESHILKVRKYSFALIPVVHLPTKIAFVENTIEPILDEQIVLQDMVDLLEVDVFSGSTLESIPRNEVKSSVFLGNH